MVKISRAFSVVVLSLLSLGVSAQVYFEVTPDPMVANQSATLAYKVIGAVDGEPDFSVLNADFEILGTNRRTSIGLSNGLQERTTSWVLSVLPKTVGTVQLPAIAFGRVSSEPRAVEVTAAGPSTSNAGADIILQVEADVTAPYVQQQVIYTIRLLHRVELSSSRFSALETTTDAIVKALGDGRQYRHQLNGITYEAFEQNYAIFPQESGPMVIKPLVLTTQVISRKRSFFERFSQGLQTQRVESEAIELDVRPVPAAFPRDATWLPARQVRLHQEWEPDVGEAEVGAPLARTVFLWADGLVAEQLPEIEMQPPAGVKVYPDQAQTSDKDTPAGFNAVMQQKFALIASTPGHGRFAEISLPWWNIETDSLELTRLPEREIAFNGSAAVAATQTGELTPVRPSTDRPIAPGTTPEPARLSWLLGAGWLFTAIGWWFSAKTRQPSRPAESVAKAPSASAKQAKAELKAACNAGQAAAARSALLAWASDQTTGTRRPLSLQSLADQSADEQLEREIRRLDQALYSRDKADWDGASLWAAFSSQRDGDAIKTAQPDVLPPLFKLAAK